MTRFATIRLNSSFIAASFSVRFFHGSFEFSNAALYLGQEYISKYHFSQQPRTPSGRNFRVGADGDAREVNVPDGEVCGLDAGDGLGVVVLVQEGAHQDKLEPSRCTSHITQCRLEFICST